MAVECILGFGKPAEKKVPVAAGKLQRDKIRRNSWR
jgi:hypothetical protein